jgi:hypothetical protein
VKGNRVGSPPVRATSVCDGGVDLGSLLGLINGVLAGITGVYLATRSVPITMIAGGSALLVATLLIVRW